MTDPDFPKFLGVGRDDELYRVCLALLRELWVVTDRVIVLEDLLVEHGVLGSGDVDVHRPSPALAAALQRERDSLIERVLDDTGPPSQAPGAPSSGAPFT